MSHIEAMKQMLHEMEYVLDCINNNVVPFDGDDFHEALRLGRQAISEAEKQEPVAWMNNERNTITWDKLYPDMTSLYTHQQPKREWVGLTEEEVADLVEYEDWYNYPADFAKTVEAKLKEKNT